MSDILDPRAEEKALLLKVQLGQREPGMVALCRLLEIRLLRCQVSMLDCQFVDFPALQAEAKTVSKLIRELKLKQN